MFSSIAGRYDIANHLLCCGLDYVWRRRVAKIVKQWNAKCILDLATGSGALAKVLQETCPGSRVVGMDFCPAMLLQAKRKGVCTLVCGDATDMPFRSGTFDVITVAFGLRNMGNYQRAIQEMARVLSCGGGLFILEFSMPKNLCVRALYRIYLHHLLPTLAAWVTGHREAYKYLGASIERFPGDRLLYFLEKYGFLETQIQRLCLGIVSLYAARRS
ncbi:MAG: ubiquinone/menaquinone biosynthesis methyltransferase [Candidatus Xiphinematobacter sp.]|nr:MAG: ubiquinone/menaquinone biosynthesis methyltransferase [Candidatus Xiphinematobacter sp.]QQY09364.1 MAG: ubiquinone/menaquinone biosynthesis methyltransferase [Candidatus Xiphinematobacter sp.]QQY11697.1 MAG: ubiquinone/menaquinone biosynthesis methyltransferase [Candidatus Xiphinematobacter sp.]